MDNKELRKTLHQLQDEIKSIKAVDDTGKVLLHNLEDDISALLERSGGNPVQVHPSVVQRLEGVVSHFEVTHPDLTTLISNLLESLSNAGI